MPLTQNKKHRFFGSRSSLSAFVVCLFLALFATAACSSPEGATWRRIREEGVLRVGLDPSYPPFEEASGDEVQGLDVDLARALAAELELEASFTYFGYDGLYDALATEQVDVLISALVIRPEQMRNFAYSDPYFNAGQILLVRGSSNQLEMADLAGQTLAVELGAEGHVVATDWQRRVRNLTVTPYNTAVEALDATAAGNADAALVDAISGRLYLQQGGELRISSQPATVEPYVMVVRIEDEVLLDQLNNALDRLKTTGQLESIQGRWLGP